MSDMKWSVFLVVLTVPWTLNRGDPEVCILMDSCILPCSFQPGDDVVIHWIQWMAGQTPAVHSYTHGGDQLSRQDQRFRGRTSLFKEQISRGNASLKLTGVEVQDQGRYRCYSSTMTKQHESYLNLNVEAPVRKVDIQQVEDRITCSSEGIYPEPELTWSTSPPSNTTPTGKPTVQQTEQLLYKISSSLVPSDSVTDLAYSCTVSAGRSSRRATLYKPISIRSSGTETTIPCNASNISLTGLIWRFNHSQVILNKTGTDVSNNVSEEWKQRVKDVSESGSLTLQGLTPNQDGIYTCELSTDEETYLTNVFLRIEERPDKPGVGGIVVCVLSLILVIAVVVVYMNYKTAYFQKCKKERARKSNKTPPDLNSLLMENEGGRTVLEKENMPSAAERSISEAPSYWWIVGLVIAVLVLALLGMLGYLTLRGNTSKHRKDREEVTELRLVRDLSADNNLHESSPLTVSGSKGQSGLRTGTQLA